MSYRVAVLLLASAIAGCGGTEVVRVPEPVTVPGPTVYVPVPESLTEDCPGRPEPLGSKIKNGVLLSAAKAWEAWAECVDGRMMEIRGLSDQRPPAGP